MFLFKLLDGRIDSPDQHLVLQVPAALQLICLE